MADGKQVSVTGWLLVGPCTGLRLLSVLNVVHLLNGLLALHLPPCIPHAHRAFRALARALTGPLRAAWAPIPGSPRTTLMRASGAASLPRCVPCSPLSCRWLGALYAHGLLPAHKLDSPAHPCIHMLQPQAAEERAKRQRVMPTGPCKLGSGADGAGGSWRHLTPTEAAARAALVSRTQTECGLGIRSQGGPSSAAHVLITCFAFQLASRLRTEYACKHR